MFFLPSNPEHVCTMYCTIYCSSLLFPQRYNFVLESAPGGRSGRSDTVGGNSIHQRSCLDAMVNCCNGLFGDISKFRNGLDTNKKLIFSLIINFRPNTCSSVIFSLTKSLCKSVLSIKIELTIAKIPSKLCQE